MRILIAEDDLTSRVMLAAVLRSQGHEVLETADGAAAWDELQKPDAPALAVLDWMMPRMDGLEVVRRVRQRSATRPFYLIMLTTRADTPDIIAGLDAGADDYLVKPFDPGELRARLEVGRRMIELQLALTAKLAELGQAVEEIKTLSGILPICAGCKRIRDDSGYWQQVEIYVRDHSEAEFSHGLCPTCVERLYPDLPAADPE
ncbi:MAG: response regulator transcription factor [Candidatus Delongbacteria bacterium]